MPLYADSFDSDTTGALPAGWSGTGWQVTAASFAQTPGNVLSAGSTAAAYYAGATWSAASVTGCLHFTAQKSSEAGLLISGRLQGSVLCGYIGTLMLSADGTPWMVLRRIGQNPLVLFAGPAVFNDGSGSQPALGLWTNMRLAYDPSAGMLRLKIWLQGYPEPTTWNATVQENLLTGPGWAGCFNDGTNPPTWDNFEVDLLTGGGAMPVPTVTGFNPLSGHVGDSVTITGTGFSAVPNENLVAFNGAAAAITSSTTTQIVALVPPGASTGPISVTTAGGAGVSSSTFTVLPAALGLNVPTISGFTPASGPPGTVVTISGSNFPTSGPGGNPANATVVTFNGATAQIVSMNGVGTQIQAIVPPNGSTGPIGVQSSAGVVYSSVSFVVTGAPPGTGGSLSPDAYAGTEVDTLASTSDLLPFLRAMLKDTATDIRQIGVLNPTWSDADLYRYLELARGEFNRHRPKRAHLLQTTSAGVQDYTVTGALAIDEVLWAPAGYDLDQIAALAAALAGGPGILWDGGVPVVGRVYFDSPASIQVWSIIRESWRKTFGGHWMPGDAPNAYRLLPTPEEDNLNVLVFYRTEAHWSDIPWQYRTFLLAQAVLFAIEALTYQIVAASPAQGAKLGYGTRALVQLVQAKYAEALNIREPRVTAGRS